jgi:hypothetical protein
VAAAEAPPPPSPPLFLLFLASITLSRPLSHSSSSRSISQWWPWMAGRWQPGSAARGGKAAAARRGRLLVAGEALQSLLGCPGQWWLLLARRSQLADQGGQWRRPLLEVASCKLCWLPRLLLALPGWFVEVIQWV